MEAEPFLLPLAVQDHSPLPAQGCHGLTPLHTRVAICILEGLIASVGGLGTFAFMTGNQMYGELKQILFLALDMGLDSELCWRKVQLAFTHSSPESLNDALTGKR